MKTLRMSAIVMGISMFLVCHGVPVGAQPRMETKDSPLFAETLNASLKRMDASSLGTRDAAETLLAALGVFTMDSESTLCEAKETLNAEDEACKEEGEDMGPPAGDDTGDMGPPAENGAGGNLPLIFGTFDGFSGLLRIPCLAIPGMEPQYVELYVKNWEERRFLLNRDALKPSPLDSADCAVFEALGGDTYMVAIPIVKSGPVAYYAEITMTDPENPVFTITRLNPVQSPPDPPDTMNPMNFRCEFTETMDPMEMDCEAVIAETMNPMECNDVIAGTMNPMDAGCDMAPTMNPMGKDCGEVIKETMNPMSTECRGTGTETMDPGELDCREPTPGP